jgi:hypothetical protein
MHVVTRPKDNLFYVKVDFDFKNVGEIGYFAANYNKVMDASKANPLVNSGSTEEGNDGPKLTGFMADGLSYSLKGRTLVRKTTHKPLDNEPKDEEMEIMEGFLSEAVYKLMFDLPGKIKKSTFSDSKIDGSKLIAEITLLDIMEQKKDMSGKVRFK